MARSNRTGAYELPETPALAQLFKVWKRKAQLAIRTHCPATVVVYNPATQTVTCTIDFLQVVKTLVAVTPGVDPNLLGMTQLSTPFILTEIPVATIGSGDSTGYLTFPIIPGCTGYIEVMDRGLTQWLNRVSQLPVDPVQAATHMLGDAIFVPGLTDKLHRIATPVDLTAAVLHHDLLIKLGRNAALGVARLTDSVTPNAEMTAFMIATVTALTTIAAAVPVVITPPVPPATTFGTITSASVKTSSE